MWFLSSQEQSVGGIYKIVKWTRESLAYCKESLQSGSGRSSENQNAHRWGVDKGCAPDVLDERKMELGLEAIHTTSAEELVSILQMSWDFVRGKV